MGAAARNDGARRALSTAVAVLALSAPAGLARAGDADDGAAARAILATLDAAAPSDAVKQTNDALERALRMRTAGDVEHARAAEGLALEWAELARDEARTLAAEKAARAAELAAIEAGARVEREQALLEEAITRSGRLRAELATVTAKEAGKKTRDRTSPLPPGETSPRAAPRKAASTAPGSAPKGTNRGHVDADAPADLGGAR